MSAHTKGPWVVEAGGPRLVNTHACVISAGDGLGPVAYSTREYAHLIAAAPDMLKALRRAVLALAFAAESSEAMRDDYNAVSAAITKATGSTS